MSSVPDTSDWTWVLERPCETCGLHAGEVPFDELPGLIRDNAAAWLPVLARSDAAVRPHD